MPSALSRALHDLAAIACIPEKRAVTRAANRGTAAHGPEAAVIRFREDAPCPTATSMTACDTARPATGWTCEGLVRMSRSGSRSPTSCDRGTGAEARSPIFAVFPLEIFARELTH
jgi:hypothetical protein